MRETSSRRLWAASDQCVSHFRLVGFAEDTILLSTYSSVYENKWNIVDALQQFVMITLLPLVDWLSGSDCTRPVSNMTLDQSRRHCKKCRCEVRKNPAWWSCEFILKVADPISYHNTLVYLTPVLYPIGSSQSQCTREPAELATRLNRKLPPYENSRSKVTGQANWYAYMLLVSQVDVN